MASDSNNKKSKKPQQNMVGAGLAIGVGVGLAIGSAMDNVSTWLAIGIALGLSIGAALQQRNNAKKDED